MLLHKMLSIKLLITWWLQEIIIILNIIIAVLKDILKAIILLTQKKFCKTIAYNETIDKGTAYDRAVKHKTEMEWRQIMEILMYDGYINNVGNPHVYRFKLTHFKNVVASFYL
ncbi:MAG: hypothetical protein WDM90_04350 [Ferruginibacter sp.]